MTTFFTVINVISVKPETGKLRSQRARKRAFERPLLMKSWGRALKTLAFWTYNH